MKTEKQIQNMIDKLKSDSRLKSPTANIQINAPLALIQLELESKISTLKWALKEAEG